jgi:DNA-binding Xre family transcriptional regulator
MKSFDIISISVNVDDIFEYVVGNSQYCPIERQIDHVRYATYDPFIYDSVEKEMIDQEEDYENFSTQLSQLRGNASKMKIDEILRICIELEEIAPKTIKL